MSDVPIKPSADGQIVYEFSDSFGLKALIATPYVNIECGDCGAVIEVIQLVDGEQRVSYSQAAIVAHRSESGCPATRSPRLVLMR